MQGNLQDMVVADLIQHNCQERNKSKLVVENGDKKAVLYFCDGAVQHAALDDIIGEEVVYEILSWEDGQFLQEMDVKSPEVSITRSWSGLLIEGARRLDESQHQLTINTEKDDVKMANIDDTLTAIMDFEGSLGAALVDWNSGMTLGSLGAGLDVELAASGNTNVVKAKLKVMKDLKIRGTIEDILISLTDQYHLIRLLNTNPNLFIYVALDRSKANLGLARHKLASLEKELTI
jgi:hypothetical protein